MVTCEKCGAEMVSTGIEITTFGDPEPVMLRFCPNKWCGSTCRVCHREMGDVHSGACADVILLKLNYPLTHVSREDF